MNNTHRPITACKALWLFVALALLYTLSRAHALTALPVFTDESDNIYWAREVWELHPLPAARVGHVLNVWWLAPFHPFENPVWVGRAATALFGLFGLAAVYGIGRRLYSRDVGLIAGALYTLSPFVFFFDRLAVPESIAVCVSLLVVLASVWAARTGRAIHAVLCGLLLAAAIAAKASMVAFLPAPLFAALTLRPEALTRGGAAKAARLLAWAYGGFAAGWAPLWLLLRARGYDLFSLVSAYTTSSPLAGLGERIQTNLEFVWEQTTAYLPAALALAAAACAVYLLLTRPRPTFYLLLVLATITGAFVAVSRTVYGRYALMLTPFLLVMLGAGLHAIGRTLFRGRRGWVLPAVVLGGWAVSSALPFFHTAYTRPEDLPLSQGDRWEYVASQTAGYGKRAAAEYLARVAAERGETVHAVGLVAACSSIDLMLAPEADVQLECPQIRWDGSHQQEHEALVGRLAAEHDLLYLLEDGLPYVRIDTLPVTLTQVERFPHPGEAVAVTVYQVQPAE